MGIIEFTNIYGEVFIGPGKADQGCWSDWITSCSEASSTSLIINKFGGEVFFYMAKATNGSASPQATLGDTTDRLRVNLGAPERKQVVLGMAFLKCVSVLARYDDPPVNQYRAIALVLKQAELFAHEAV